MVRRQISASPKICRAPRAGAYVRLNVKFNRTNIRQTVATHRKANDEPTPQRSTNITPQNNRPTVSGLNRTGHAAPRVLSIKTPVTHSHVRTFASKPSEPEPRVDTQRTYGVSRERREGKKRTREAGARKERRELNYRSRNIYAALHDMHALHRDDKLTSCNATLVIN